MGNVIEEIVMQNMKFMALVKNTDAGGLSGLYSKEAKLLPPNMNEFNGREAIKAFWDGGFFMGIKEISLETGEIVPAGEMAIETGKYTLKVLPGGSSSIITDMGKYVVIWKNEDNQWKLHIDIWNTSISD